MDWLRDHSYLAAWLALPVAIFVVILQNKGKKLAEMDWSRLLIYLAFLIALAVTITPTFDKTARDITKLIVFMGLGFLIVDRRRGYMKTTAYDETYKRFTNNLSYTIGRYNGYSSNLAPKERKYTKVGVLEGMNEVKAAQLQLLSLCGKHVQSILSEAEPEWLNDVDSFGKTAPLIERKLKETAFKDRT